MYQHSARTLRRQGALKIAVKHVEDGVGGANRHRVREPPANLVMKHADGGGSGESLVVGGVAVVAEASAAMEKKRSE